MFETDQFGIDAFLLCFGGKIGGQFFRVAGFRTVGDRDACRRRVRRVSGQGGAAAGQVRPPRSMRSLRDHAGQVTAQPDQLFPGCAGNQFLH